MKKYFWRIKASQLEVGYSDCISWGYNPIYIGIDFAKNAKELKNFLEKKFNITLCGRAKKEDIGRRRFFLLWYKELEEGGYWDTMWLEKLKCKYNNCKKTYTKLEEKQFDNSFSGFCSKKCRNSYEEEENTIKQAMDNEKYPENGQIYKIENKKTGKIYIGMTLRHSFWRWCEHASWVKPIEDFIFEILESGIPKEKIKKKETEYIKKYNSIENGYNSIF